MSLVVGDLLAQLKSCPVLVDIGSAGGPPAIWRAIAPWSTYVAFEPDPSRPQEGATQFKQAIAVKGAAVVDEHTRTAALHVTAAPDCSSLLNPDREALSEFLFAPLFDVRRTEEVPATTLQRELARLSLDRIDWLKADTQGTDLRLFQSLGDEIRTRVLALDVEPGLVDAYEGEDLFVDTHKVLVGQGFWLSNLRLGHAVRMRRATLDVLARRHQDVTPALVERAVRRTPAWVEARYLRTVGWLLERRLTATEFVLLWIFAMLDEQVGFALDLALAYEHSFGCDAVFNVMESEALRILRLDAKPKRFAGLRRTVRRLIA